MPPQAWRCLARPPSSLATPWDAKHVGDPRIKYNQIHVLRSKIRVVFVFKSVKGETPLVSSVLDEDSGDALRDEQDADVGGLQCRAGWRVVCSTQGTQILVRMDEAYVYPGRTR